MLLQSGAAIYTKFPDGATVFTAELKALLLALEHVSKLSQNDKFIIFLDSLSALQVL